MSWESRNSPNHSGPRRRTLGVVIHSTRGGAPSQETEYMATLNWFASSGSQVSAHRVIGHDGDGAIVVDDALIAWHATDHNAEWLGVELTEPTINDPYSDEQYAALRGLLQEWSATYGFPLDREHLVAHSEINSQKTDPGPLFSWEKLLQTEAPEEATDMPSIVDSLNVIWEKLSQIQADSSASTTVKELAEDAKQKGVVEIKKAIGLQ
ncbi:MAG: N-acetylmuramoyl-L-alanine amidase [Chloroflexi bacterium]|nr:N-acetylmuramoyl-L-alanine amidase [Chloroflexota bacterium]